MRRRTREKISVDRSKLITAGELVLSELIESARSSMDFRRADSISSALLEKHQLLRDAADEIARYLDPENVAQFDRDVLDGRVDFFSVFKPDPTATRIQHVRRRIDFLRSDSTKHIQSSLRSTEFDVETRRIPWEGL